MSAKKGKLTSQEAEYEKYKITPEEAQLIIETTIVGKDGIAKVYECKECQKQFPTRYQLTRHLKIHTGERRFVCDVCNKAYKEHSTLWHHKKTHLEVPGHECTVCHKQFSRKHILKEHMHQHLGVKPYTCEICGKSFRQKSSLYVHAKIHKDSNTDCKCVLCGKSFASLQSRLHHEKLCKLTRSVMIYPCLMCTEVFVSEALLQIHNNKVHMTDAEKQNAKLEDDIQKMLSVPSPLLVLPNNGRGLGQNYVIVKQNEKAVEIEGQKGEKIASILKIEANGTEEVEKKLSKVRGKCKSKSGEQKLVDICPRNVKIKEENQTNGSVSENEMMDKRKGQSAGQNLIQNVNKPIIYVIHNPPNTSVIAENSIGVSGSQNIAPKLLSDPNSIQVSTTIGQHATLNNKSVVNASDSKSIDVASNNVIFIPTEIASNHQCASTINLEQQLLSTQGADVNSDSETNSSSRVNREKESNDGKKETSHNLSSSSHIPKSVFVLVDSAPSTDHSIKQNIPEPEQTKNRREEATLLPAASNSLPETSASQQGKMAKPKLDVVADDSIDGLGVEHKTAASSERADNSNDDVAKTKSLTAHADRLPVKPTDDIDREAEALMTLAGMSDGEIHIPWIQKAESWVLNLIQVYYQSPSSKAKEIARHQLSKIDRQLLSHRPNKVTIMDMIRQQENKGADTEEMIERLCEKLEVNKLKMKETVRMLKDGKKSFVKMDVPKDRKLPQIEHLSNTEKNALEPFVIVPIVKQSDGKLVMTVPENPAHVPVVWLQNQKQQTLKRPADPMCGPVQPRGKRSKQVSILPKRPGMKMTEPVVAPKKKTLSEASKRLRHLIESGALKPPTTPGRRGPMPEFKRPAALPQKIHGKTAGQLCSKLKLDAKLSKQVLGQKNNMVSIVQIPLQIPGALQQNLQPSNSPSLEQVSIMPGRSLSAVQVSENSTVQVGESHVKATIASPLEIPSTSVVSSVTQNSSPILANQILSTNCHWSNAIGLNIGEIGNFLNSQASTQLASIDQSNDRIDSLVSHNELKENLGSVQKLNVEQIDLRENAPKATFPSDASGLIDTMMSSVEAVNCLSKTMSLGHELPVSTEYSPVSPDFLPTSSEFSSLTTSFTTCSQGFTPVSLDYSTAQSEYSTCTESPVSSSHFTQNENEEANLPYGYSPAADELTNDRLNISLDVDIADLANDSDNSIFNLLKQDSNQDLPISPEKFFNLSLSKQLEMEDAKSVTVPLPERFLNLTKSLDLEENKRAYLPIPEKFFNLSPIKLDDMEDGEKANMLAEKLIDIATSSMHNSTLKDDEAIEQNNDISSEVSDLGFSLLQDTYSDNCSKQTKTISTPDTTAIQDNAEFNDIALLSTSTSSPGKSILQGQFSSFSFSNQNESLSPVRPVLRDSDSTNNSPLKDDVCLGFSQASSQTWHRAEIQTEDSSSQAAKDPYPALDFSSFLPGELDLSNSVGGFKEALCVADTPPGRYTDSKKDKDDGNDSRGSHVKMDTSKKDDGLHCLECYADGMKTGYPGDEEDTRESFSIVMENMKQIHQ